MTHDLASDQRWQRFNDRNWVCACCGSRHGGMFDLGCEKPDPWPGTEAALPNSAIAGATHVVTEDFCILNGEHYFVRGVLQLPIIGSGGGVFGFGVWSTLSKASFDTYLETFDRGDQAKLGPRFGWFSNRLKGYPDTANLKCQVLSQDGRQRPLIELEPTDHVLAVEQRDGITFDRLLEIYAINGHDMRVALMQE